MLVNLPVFDFFVNGPLPSNSRCSTSQEFSLGFHLYWRLSSSLWVYRRQCSLEILLSNQMLLTPWNIIHVCYLPGWDSIVFTGLLRKILTQVMARRKNDGQVHLTLSSGPRWGSLSSSGPQKLPQHLPPIAAPCGTQQFCSLQHLGCQNLALGSGLILPSSKLNLHLVRGAKAFNMSYFRWIFNSYRPLYILLCTCMHAWIDLNLIFFCMFNSCNK